MKSDDPRKTHTILVVDDDAGIRGTLCELLEDEGYEAMGFPDGQRAMDWLRANGSDERPCMILLDLMMPGMNGWAFRKEQSSDPALRRIPVVVITAAGENCEPIDASEILPKPLRIETVLSVVAHYC